jgi:hypothetical protein
MSGIQRAIHSLELPKPHLHRIDPDLDGDSALINVFYDGIITTECHEAIDSFFQKMQKCYHDEDVHLEVKK